MENMAASGYAAQTSLERNAHHRTASDTITTPNMAHGN